MYSDVTTLFLHNLSSENSEVVIQNFNSFKKYGNTVIPIKDEDSEGLQDSVSVPVNSFIPRKPKGYGRWTSPDVVYINYILQNKDNLTSKYYMLAEYDCYCESNLGLLFDDYKENDVVVPRFFDFKESPNWQWFDGVRGKIEEKFLTGFIPGTFILFSKEAIVKVAEKYKELWPLLESTNVEARLGIVSRILNLKIKVYENFNANVNWFPIHFKKNRSIYHPVKTIVNNNFFIKNPSSLSENYGLWEFGRFNNEKEKICNLYLQKDGFINHQFHDNEFYWGEDGKNILFYNSRGNITTIFNNKDDNIYIGDYYNGELEPSLIKEKYHWLKRSSV